MQKVIVFIFLVFFSQAGIAQQQGFVYLEASNRQPFYVLQGGQVFSSTPNGYLLMRSKQRDTLDISIGFPRERWKRTRFRVPVTGQDNYWQWLQVDTGSWALYDKLLRKWIQEEVGVDAEKAGMASDSLSTDVFARWLEAEGDSKKNEKKSVGIETSKDRRGVELDLGWLMRYEDSGDTVWVWVPLDESQILKSGLKDDVQWRVWYEEAMLERAWEAELRQQVNQGEKRKKQGE